MSDLSVPDLSPSDLSLSDPSLRRKSRLPASAARSHIGYGPHFRKSVFLLGRTPDTFQPIEQLLTQLKCEVTAIASTENLSDLSQGDLSQSSPCLVIVADADQQWAAEAIAALRQRLDHPPVTVLVVDDQRDLATAITRSSEPIDGYLVQPVDRCVLGSLIHAAAVRQFC